MSRLIVLVHPRHTDPGFTSTSLALKRRDRRCRAGCASSANEKGVVRMGESVLCAFHSAAWSMGWLGSNVATWWHFVGHHVKVPTLVQLLLLLLFFFVFFVFFCYCCFSFFLLLSSSLSIIIIIIIIINPVFKMPRQATEALSSLSLSSSPSPSSSLSTSPHHHSHYHRPNRCWMTLKKN